MKNQVSQNKVLEKTHHANNNQKKARIVILIIDCRTKTIPMDNESLS